ncbi:MAG: heavy metal-binding domain-containing protein [Bryobacteraceae bacterium]
MRLLVPLLFAAALLIAAESPKAPVPPPPQVNLDYVCPMDPDVRSDKPGKCPRCGMTLVLGIPNPVEYPMDVTVDPQPFHAGEPVKLIFTVRDPKTGDVVQHYSIVHEKLFHMFLVSRDLQFFKHDHPVLGADSRFRFAITFPKPGMYEAVGDFYPTGGTPQIIARTVFVPGGPGWNPTLGPATLKPDLSTKQCANMQVGLTTDPPQPIAGMKTLMFFHITPSEGLEKYLGAWGHMLAASDDLVDLIHNHPFIPVGGPSIQFNMIFPRARTYRVWVQFQRKGVVNTAVFNVPVSELK